MATPRSELAFFFLPFAPAAPRSVPESEDESDELPLSWLLPSGVERRLFQFADGAGGGKSPKFGLASRRSTDASLGADTVRWRAPMSLDALRWWPLAGEATGVTLAPGRVFSTTWTFLGGSSSLEPLSMTEASPRPRTDEPPTMDVR